MTLRLTLRRLVAYALDIVMLAAVLLPVAFGAAVVLGTEDVGPQVVWSRALLFVSVPAWVYFIVMERRRGATVAKRILGLRSGLADGSSPGWGAAIMRTAVKLLPWELVHIAFFALSDDLTTLSGLQIGIAGAAYALMLGLVLVPLFTGGHRSLHDLVAGTRVEGG